MREARWRPRGGTRRDLRIRPDVFGPPIITQLGLIWAGRRHLDPGATMPGTPQTPAEAAIRGISTVYQWWFGPLPLAFAVLAVDASNLRSSVHLVKYYYALNVTVTCFVIRCKSLQRTSVQTYSNLICAYPGLRGIKPVPVPREGQLPAEAMGLSRTDNADGQFPNALNMYKPINAAVSSKCPELPHFCIYSGSWVQVPAPSPYEAELGDYQPDRSSAKGFSWKHLAEDPF